MSKKTILLLGSLIAVAILGIATIKIFNKSSEGSDGKENDKIQVVTTIYPITMIGLNIADHVEGIEIKSLTEMNTGCLHDYQLTSEDMKMISTADLLIINGGGMEQFLDDVLENYPNLKIIDSSEGIEMLSYEAWELHEHDHDHEEEDIEYNSHVWLNPELYLKQIENVRDGLVEYMKENKENTMELVQAIEENTNTYLQKVNDLNTEIEENLQLYPSDENGNVEEKAVIFHDAFAYLAERVGLEVAYTIPLEEDTTLSAAQIAEIIDAVRKDDIKYLFTEKQYSDTIANRIEAETGASVYIIDSVVTGDGSKDSYINAMQQNFNVMKEAFKK